MPLFLRASHTSFVTAVAVATTIAACGGDGPGAAPGDVTDSGLNPPSDTGGGTDATSDDVAVDAPAPLPRQVRAACAAPVLAEASPIAALGRVTRVSAASSGSEVGVVYAARNKDDNAIPFFVRLDHHTGSVKGAPVALSTDRMKDDEAFTIVSDGARYITCWNSTASGSVRVLCVVIGTGTSTPTPAYTTATGSNAYSPTLAFDGSNRAVAHSAGAVGNARRLDDRGQPIDGSHFGVGPHGILTDRYPGFLAATTARSSGRIDYDIFDTVGTRVGSPAFLNVPGDLVALASIGVKHLALLVDGDAAVSVPLTAGSTATTLDRDAYIRSSNQARGSIAPAVDSFAVAWSRFADVEPRSIRYRAVAADGTPIAPALPVAGRGSGPVAIAAVVDGFLLVATGGAEGDSLVPTHLACP